MEEGVLHDKGKERRGGADDNNNSTLSSTSMKLSLAERTMIGRQTNCGPTCHSSNPLLLPAIITATEIIKGPPLHVSALQSVSSEEGEALTITKK